jgi:hypothetical protein
MKKIILCLFFVFTIINVQTQESQKIAPRLDFTYLKKSDGSKLLTASLYIIKDRKNYPVPGTVINYQIGETKVDINTNSDGKAYMILDSKRETDKNIEGVSSFVASFSGNDTLESVTQEIKVKDVFIDLVLEEVDSVRTISVLVTEKSAKGEQIPVSGQTVNIYVPRMFSMLKIGEETTDDQGKISMEFPNDLPGNTDSTITVYARIEESEVYANVESLKKERWGVPIIHRIPESHRALWTEIAPIWMIITLTVLLLGVWGHYIFAIIQLILIKRESKKNQA